MASIVPGKKFYSQAEFDEAKSKYEWEQRVPYTVINCTKRERYNGKLKPGRPEVPETFDWKDAILACKHFGGVREHEHVEGKARRPNQSSYKRDCLAKFNIIYSLDEKCYFVKTVETNHRNHELVARSDLHLHYPEFKNPDQNTLDEVSKLFDYDVKRHKIRDLLVANGIKATSQDIQNLRNKWNAKFKGTDSREDALFKQLHLLKEEDPNSIVVITHDPETFVVQSVFFQTSEMRAAHELYPEVLIMDTTYQLSENDMPLIVYEGIDCFGSGRILGYALIISEKLPIVTASLELLKLGCPDVSEKVQVVLVDKDQSELAAIKQVLPNAEVHLCDYHVKDAMKRTGFKKLAGDKCDEVKPILDKLVYAFSKVDYDAAYAKLQEVVGVESKFMKYFDKYWHNSGLIWTEYRRNLAFTLGERTTGRVECHNARIKEIIDKKIPVAMVIMRLRTINRNSSIEHDHKLFVSLVKTKYHKYTKDPVVQTIVKSNTPFVADMLKRQYERSLEPPSDNIHKVNTTQCDCAFYTKFQLTCAHIFRERRIKGLEIYDHSVIPKRWTVVMEISKDKKISNVDILIAPIKQPKKREPLFAEDRYNLADRICKRICSLIAQHGGKDFDEQINVLLNIEEMLKSGKGIAVIGISADGQVDKTVMTVEEDGKDNGNKEAENVTSKSNADIVSQALQGRGVLSLQNLGTELEKQLKLPPKHVVKGRPKGKKKVQDIRKKGRNDANNDEDEVEDVDGDLTVKQCDVCKGPVTCRTSFSKKNYGRTIITCSTRKTDDCRAFYKWDMPVDIPPPSSGRVQSEQQDTAAGNPLINPEEQAENNPCFICKTQGPPTGAHQCDMCSKAIHILDGSCSVATSIVVEGFGKTGRICLKCAKDETKTDSISFLKDSILPTVDVSLVNSILTSETRVLADVEFIDLTPDDGEAFDEPGSTHSAHISPTSSPERSKSHSQIISQVSTPVKTAQVSDNFPPVTKTPTTDKICFGCGQKAVLRTSTKGRSMGQKFYTCSNPVSERCRKFINWTKWVRTGSPTLANKTIPEFFPQVDRAKESATRSSYHELLDDNEGDNILSNVLDLPSTPQLPEVNNTDVMGMETENMVEVEIEEWRMTCEICMKTPGVFNYLDFCDVCGVPVHTEENSCAVPVTPDDSDIWLCLKCKRAGEVFVVPTVDERANITVRSSKRGSDHSNDVALEEVLKELHQNTGRPVRQINMPKRLRTSYEFN